MSERTSLVGRTFGKFTVIADAPHVPHKGRRSICLCACGVTKSVYNNNLVRGHQKSCGCGRMGKLPIHGHAGNGHVSAIYYAWKSMRYRCQKPSHPAYHNYGGRGITVCPEWEDFQTFMRDMGEPPPGKQLERINNDLGYCKDNCTWATRKEQLRNQRTNLVLTVRGVTGCAVALAEHFGVHYHRTLSRLKRGWDVERAFFAPIDQTRKRKQTVIK